MRLRTNYMLLHFFSRRVNNPVLLGKRQSDSLIGGIANDLLGFDCLRFFQSLEQEGGEPAVPFLRQKSAPPQ